MPGAPHEDAATRARALDFSAAFVRDQLAAMPLVLQILLLAGLTCFHALTLLRWGCGFAELDLPRRSAWLNAWAYGRSAIARQLFRPVRSLAALAYYEAVES